MLAERDARRGRARRPLSVSYCTARDRGRPVIRKAPVSAASSLPLLTSITTEPAGVSAAMLKVAET